MLRINCAKLVVFVFFYKHFAKAIFKTAYCFMSIYRYFLNLYLFVITKMF